jgi:hypothetical protein
MMLTVQQIPLPPVPGGHMSVGGTLSDPAAVMITIAVMGTLLLLLWPLIRAFARRLEGGARSNELQAEVETLRSRVQQLEEGQGRLAELEERLDFAERMLAQSREPDRLQG